MVPPPQDRPFCCLDFFDTYPTCNGVAMPLQVGWIQDSRFPETLLSKSWIQILNPTPGFKIQDSWGLFPANLESRIQDSRFKIPRDSLQEILNPGFKMDSRFAPKSSWESWILNPGVGFKICSKEFLGILNLESSGWIQDLLQRVPGNIESWNLGLKNRPRIYGIGTSNQSVPEMAIENLV